MKLSFFLFFVAILVTQKAVEAAPGSLGEFKSVVPIPSGIRVTFHDNGERWFYQVGNAENFKPDKGTLSNYGESIDIQNSQSAEFVTRHLAIYISPVAGRPGSFTVEKHIDFRSFGHGLTRETFILSVQSGVIVYGTMTEKSS